jgi:hypothetical protein
MTLEMYDSERLDGMSLRVLDVCARLRNLAQKCRQEELPPIGLHDRKALEWLEKLEDWLVRAEGEVNRAVHKTHGERRARQTQATRAKPS